MKIKLSVLLLVVFLQLLLCNRASAERPEAFRDLPDAAIEAINTLDLRQQWLENRTLELTSAQTYSLANGKTSKHNNGDISITGFDPATERAYTLTLGKSASFGEFRSAEGHWLVTTDRQGSWMVKLPDQGLRYNHCGLDHPHSGHQRASTPTGQTVTTASTGGTVIDILIIYNRAFAQRYPGDILETRLNHLVAISNSILLNTGVDLAVQLVGHQQFNYANFKSNLDFRNDIALTLGGAEQPGLEGLATLRNQLGADLVIGFRPHDIEKRGSCGIAFFPDENPNLGVNVVSDGMSSWSVCLDDTMTHEIGHNLGAAHQQGLGGGFPDPRGAAFVRPGQYSTVMSSFGTGQDDRFRGLPIFSNPQVSCGGASCGSFLNADNASVIRDFMPEVAAYRTAIAPPPPVTGDTPRPDIDSDGDGTSDWRDAFPFDATEQADSDLDGVGDNADAFKLSSAEQRDTDGNGIGDNTDTDDDGDGEADVTDAFPLDPAETSDTDGDGRGNNKDAFPNLASEQDDADDDGQGNHADSDDDNDGVNEFDPARQDLLVISAGNNRILRFDAQTGAPRGVEVINPNALLTFQSDLDYRPLDNTLVYTAGSAVRKLNLLNRQELGVWVPAYDDSPNPGAELGTGFPTGLATIGNQIAVTRQGDPQVAFFSGQEVATTSGPPLPTLLAESRPLDITSDGQTAWVLVRNQRSLYRIINGSANLLAGPGLGWMQDPRRMLVTADGRLLISDANRNSVVAVNASNGQFLGDLMDFDSSGYNQPDGLVQLADGTVLVAAAAQDAILAFDPDSGAFLGERVSSASEALSEPRAMALVPALLDYVADDPDRSFRPNAGFWSNIETDGRGFDIQVSGRRLSVVWYTYDELGQPTWYLAVGRLNGRAFSRPLLRFTLDDEGQASQNSVGTLQLEFTDARQALVSFNVQGQSGSEPLTWQRFSPDPASPDHTAVWGRADGPGWGLSIARQGTLSIAVAYIYDASGAPRWLLSRPSKGALPTDFLMQASFSTGLCPGCAGPRSFEFSDAGTMNIQLPETTSGAQGVWSSAVSLPLPLAGDWLLEDTAVVRFSDTPERPR